jgi:hypothetical protein
MLPLLRSFLITILISLGTAFSLRNVFGLWETFTLVTALQYIVSFIVKTYEERAGQVAQLTQTLDEILSRQEINVECPCGKNEIPVTIFIDEETIVKCDACKNKFKVVTEISTRLITEPLVLESMFNTLNEQQYN